MKTYYIMYNVGKVKYLVNYHDGIKTHNDGSEFFDIATFKNKKKMNSFIADLEEKGYVPRPFNHKPKPKEEQNWNHFILHLNKGLPLEILGPFTRPERNKEMKKLESKYDGTYHYFMLLSMQGIIQTIQVDEICWSKKSKENYSGKEYTIIPCSECGKDFKRDAIDFLLGLSEESNTICPDCKTGNDTLLKSWEVTLKGYDGGSDETDHLIKWYVADTKKEVEDDLKVKSLEWDTIEELPERLANISYDVKLLKP